MIILSQILFGNSLPCHSASSGIAHLYRASSNLGQFIEIDRGTWDDRPLSASAHFQTNPAAKIDKP